MKSLAELAAIRDKMQDSLNLRKEDHAGTKIIVGMATCGIAAGARPVLTAFVGEINAKHVKDVMVTQTGCMGMCNLEPVVVVEREGQEKVTYVKVTPEMAVKIIDEHIVEGKVITEYTIGAAE